MSRRTVILLVTAAALTAGGVFGWSTLRQIAFALRASAREGTDYERLEADRAKEARAADAPAAPTSPESELAPYWTGFRGPTRDGVYGERELALPWPEEGPRLLWKRPIGGGLGSFAVAGGRAFTLEQRREREALVAYDLVTGAELWARNWDARFRETFSGEGPRSTPAVRGDRVYSLGAEGELRCSDVHDGGIVWRRNVLADAGAPNLEYGLAGSPLVAGELLLVTNGGPALSAYDLATGAPRWTALEEPGAYASPLLATVAGRHQVLLVTSRRVAGVDPDDGALLWDYPWEFSGPACNEAFPISDSDLLVTAGYGHGAARLRISADGGVLSAEGLWRSRRLRTRFSPAVTVDGHVYGFDEEALVCLDLEDGRRVWKGKRYGYGQLVLAGQWLVVTTEDGEVALVRATPHEFVEERLVEAVEGMTMNVPAVAHGLLLVRNDHEVACFDLR